MGHLKMPIPLRSALQTVDQYFSPNCFVQYACSALSPMTSASAGSVISRRNLDTLPSREHDQRRNDLHPTCHDQVTFEKGDVAAKTRHFARKSGKLAVAIWKFDSTALTPPRDQRWMEKLDEEIFGGDC